MFSVFYGKILPFQSTPSVWRETPRYSMTHRRKAFQSTPSVWRETACFWEKILQDVYFNPLPPCGGRPSDESTHSGRGLFQSTPSVWRETSLLVFSVPPKVHFNPLPPCGGRPVDAAIWLIAWLFQSTPSVWRETFPDRRSEIRQTISIHSLRVEGDNRSQSQKSVTTISIHSLRVEGDRMNKIKVTYRVFQSTPSVWRETSQTGQKCVKSAISIHSLRVEGDQ